MPITWRFAAGRGPQDVLIGWFSHGWPRKICSLVHNLSQPTNLSQPPTGRYSAGDNGLLRERAYEPSSGGQLCGRRIAKNSL
jgi:hypothetical protein